MYRCGSCTAQLTPYATGLINASYAYQPKRKAHACGYNIIHVPDMNGS